MPSFSPEARFRSGGHRACGAGLSVLACTEMPVASRLTSPRRRSATSFAERAPSSGALPRSPFWKGANRMLHPAKPAPPTVSNVQLLLAYVADLELEVDRLRKQGQFIQHEARGTL